jgi:citrate lyase subunit beta/citryl-CoA lyase
VVVHPKFVDVVNEAYTPTAEELASAKRVLEAFDEASARGEGAIKVDGVMIDKPVYHRAKDLLEQA